MTFPFQTLRANFPVHPLQDTNGLICGFGLYREKPVEALGLGEVAHKISVGEPFWLHFSLADLRARNWILNCAAIPQIARDVLLSDNPHIGFESIHQGLIGVLGDQRNGLYEDPDSFGTIRLYASSKMIVSIRIHPMKSVDRLRRDAMHGLIVQSPIQLVAQLLNRLADTFGVTVAALGETVDNTEERLLMDRLASDAQDLGLERRYMARLRRHIAFPRNRDLGEELEQWCAVDDANQLRRALGRLEAVAQDVELVQIRARLVQEEFASRLNEATNRNILFLSIVTAIFLPVTLITSIFGMNVNGLPFVDQPSGFFNAMGLLAATFFGTLVILRWRRLI